MYIRLYPGDIPNFPTIEVRFFPWIPIITMIENYFLKGQNIPLPSIKPHYFVLITKFQPISGRWPPKDVWVYVFRESWPDEKRANLKQIYCRGHRNDGNGWIHCWLHVPLYNIYIYIVYIYIYCIYILYIYIYCIYIYTVYIYVYIIPIIFPLWSYW